MTPGFGITGSLSNKLIDYMMAGKPVVASYSGYQSMLNEANAGLFVPAGSMLSLRLFTFLKIWTHMRETSMALEVNLGLRKTMITRL